MDSIMDEKEIDAILNIDSSNQRDISLVNDEMLDAILGDGNNEAFSNGFAKSDDLHREGGTDARDKREVRLLNGNEKEKEQIDETNVVCSVAALSDVVEEPDEPEQLDYEEDNDEDRPQRSSKFTSERKVDSSPTEKASAFSSNKPKGPEYRPGLYRGEHPSSKRVRHFNPRGGKFHVNPNFRNPSVNPFQTNIISSTSQCSIPTAPQLSGFSLGKPSSVIQQFPPSMFFPAHNVALMPGSGASMIANLVSHQPPNMFQNRAPTSFYNQQQHPSMELTGSHNFHLPPMIGTNEQQMLKFNQQSRDGANWELMVDAFVKKATSKKMDSRSRHSSRSSSYSDSYYSSKSRSPALPRSLGRVNRPKSKSPIRRNKDRPKSRGKSRRNTNKTGLSSRRCYSISPDRSAVNKTVKEKEAKKYTIECAKAIGLDEDYLKKVEEQKRLREEIQKRKMHGRNERNVHTREKTSRNNGKKGSSSLKATTSRSRVEEAPASRDSIECDVKPKHPRIEAVEAEDKTQDAVKTSVKLKPLKPYLAVVVNNIKTLQNSYKRLSLIASSLGHTKVLLLNL